MKKNIQKLTNVFSRHTTARDLGNFLEGLFTPKEIEEFVKRIEIVTLLKKGVPQHVIAKELSVGVATFTRGSKELQQGRFQNV